jgi:hypothetical protein
MDDDYGRGERDHLDEPLNERGGTGKLEAKSSDAWCVGVEVEIKVEVEGRKRRRAARYGEYQQDAVLMIACCCSRPHDTPGRGEALHTTASGSSSSPTEFSHSGSGSQGWHGRIRQASIPQRAFPCWPTASVWLDGGPLSIPYGGCTGSGRAPESRRSRGVQSAE